MNLEAQWIVGFVDGEGCFHVGINQNKTMNLGFQVLPEFTVVQHERSIHVLYALKAYFACGVVRRNRGNCFCYRVRGQTNLLNRVVPFFEKHSLKTEKRVDFLKFRRVLLAMQKGEHLTPEGLDRIRGLKAQMNKNKNKNKNRR